MAHKIETGINPRYKTIDIVSCDISREILEVSMPLVSRGKILPKGKGFSFRLEHPLPSFKVYRALTEHGFGADVRNCINTRKRSTITPDYVWAGVLRFAGNVVPRLEHPHYSHCLDLLRDELDVQTKINPISMSEAVKKIPTATSPGLPFIQTHPGSSKGDILLTHSDKISRYWDRIGNRQPVIPIPDCAAFARSHISEIGENKVRPVWSYPLYIIAEEARYFNPILDELTSQRCFRRSAYGMEIMKGGMLWLNNQIKEALIKGYNNYLCADFSSFDATVPAWLIRDVFSVIKEKFNFTPEDEIKFNKVVQYFINTPIRNMDGRRFMKDHGIPSGSMFTNIIGSCVNFVIMQFILPLVAGKIGFINVFGDDSITALSDKSIINLDNLANCFKNAFGLDLNTKKSYWTTRITNIHYLGYYNYHGDPFKPSAELVASMLYSQYFKDDWGYAIARACGCALAACGNTNIYYMARAVYTKGKRENSENPLRGLELLKTNPRMQRHLTTMGCGDWNFDEEIFLSARNFMPRLDCTKLTLAINTVYI